MRGADAGSSSGSDNSLQLSDIWSMIVKNKWWFILSIFLCLCVAAFYKYRTASVYQRSAKIIIDESESNSALRDLYSISDGLSGMNSGGGINVNNEIEYISSPDLMETVVTRLGLQTKYYKHQFLRTRELYSNSPIAVSFSNLDKHSFVSFKITNKKDSSFVITDLMVAISGKLAKVPGVSQIDGHYGDSLATPVATVLVEPTVNYSAWGINEQITVTWTTARNVAMQLESNLSVALADTKSSVVNISIKDNSPTRASSVISSLIDVYNEVCINNQNRSARNTTQFINDRLVVIEKELGGVETDLKNYKEEHGITDIDAVSQNYLTSSSSYQDKSFEANNQLSIAKYIKEYLNSPSNSRSLIPANSGLTSESINNQIKEYNDLLLKRDRLLSSSSVKNPVIADMNQSLESMKAAINHSIDNLIATLQMQVDKINSQQNLIMSRIASTSGQELQLLSIERQQKVKEQLYVYLLQKREENEIASLVNVGNTRTIVTPTGSSAPVSPNVVNLALLALLIGILIPLAVILINYYLSTKISSKEDLGNLQAPFLASIPQVGISNSWFKNKRLNRYDPDSTKIYVKEGSRDSINEAFRILRTNIDMMLTAKNPVLMVTSYLPGSGKSFISLNTASVMSLKGKKVLLIDADLRKATLGKALKMNKHGYAGYLNGRKDSYAESIHKLEDNLYFLPIGTLPPNPSELLLSDKFSGMIEALRKEYDYVVLDCPPIDMVADTSIIAKVADLTLVVVRAGLFDKRNVYLLNETYASKRFNGMAIVLNGVDFTNGHYSYAHYGYGYGYGSYDYGSDDSEGKDSKKAAKS